MNGVWYDLYIFSYPLGRDSQLVCDPSGAADRVRAALCEAGVVFQEMNSGAGEEWDRVEHDHTGVFCWSQHLRVDDIWASVTAAREALAALGAPPETEFRVVGRTLIGAVKQIVRTYYLRPAEGFDEWWDLDQVERSSALRVG
jgi:hypothetical protein